MSGPDWLKICHFFKTLFQAGGMQQHLLHNIFYVWTNFSHELFIFIYVWKFNSFFFFFGCSFEGEISFTSNKKNYLWGKWNLGRFNKIRKCEKWKLFLLAWLLHLSLLLRVWYHSLVMEQFKRYISESKKH